MKKMLMSLCGVAFILGSCYSETHNKEEKKEEKVIERPADQSQPKPPEVKAPEVKAPEVNIEVKDTPGQN